jgi:hypothetical protein
MAGLSPEHDFQSDELNGNLYLGSERDDLSPILLGLGTVDVCTSTPSVNMLKPQLPQIFLLSQDPQDKLNTQRRGVKQRDRPTWSPETRKSG